MIHLNPNQSRLSTHHLNSLSLRIIPASSDALGLTMKMTCEFVSFRTTISNPHLYDRVTFRCVTSDTDTGIDRPTLFSYLGRLRGIMCSHYRMHLYLSSVSSTIATANYVLARFSTEMNFNIRVIIIDVIIRPKYESMQSAVNCSARTGNNI